MSIQRKPADPEALLKRMAGLCAKSEQCTSDISTKLYKAGLPKAKRDEIIEYLTTNRYIDDARFARSFASYKVRFSAWGKRKIRMALAAKRIPSDLVAAALDNINDEDYETALKKAISAAERTLKPDEKNPWQVIYRRLLARGFESSMISRFL